MFTMGLLIGEDSSNTSSAFRLVGVLIGMSFSFSDSFSLPFTEALTELRVLAVDTARDREGVGRAAFVLLPSVDTISALAGVALFLAGVGLFNGALDKGVRALVWALGLAGVRMERLGEDTGDLEMARVLVRGRFTGGSG